MAAKTKLELIEVSRKEYEKLAKLIGQMDESCACKIRGDNTSFKDVVAHRAHLITLFLGWYRDGVAGNPVYFPAQGYKWNDLKRYNADLRARQVGLSWADAVALLDDNTQKLMDFIESTPEADLYGGPMKGANNAWTPGRWAEAAGPSHFRSAAKFIRKSIKSDMPKV